MPDFLGRDLWVGPAPFRPFNNAFCFPGPKWYRWWDFGNGTMLIWAVIATTCLGGLLKLDALLTIEPLTGPNRTIHRAGLHERQVPRARGDGYPALEHTWYQGTEKPKIWRDKKIPQWGDATLFIGEKGMVISDYGRHASSRG